MNSEQVPPRRAPTAWLCRSAAPTAFFVLLASCTNEAPPLPQVVLYIDTDAPVLSQLERDEALSADAAVDTVVVQLLDPETLIAREGRTFVASDADDWPLSLGIATPESGTPHAWLRVRALRGVYATPDDRPESGGLEPIPEVTIDRLVRVELPQEEEVSRRLLVLHTECMGIQSRFFPTASTCVDQDHPMADPAEGLAALAEAPSGSVVGSWPHVRAADCSATVEPHQVCIPGGFSVLGDPRLGGVEFIGFIESVPLRPARLTPFRLDRTEYTVGRFKQLLLRDDLGGSRPLEPGDGRLQHCRWTTAADTRYDDYPLNCVSEALADRICEAEGGFLPSEAQWEHAARGRGQRRLYPWGDEQVTCCAASAGRGNEPGDQTLCDGLGPEPVGSHADPTACEGLTDVSRDGVVDMAGSVAEVMRDAMRPYDDDCWSAEGVLVDPVCEDPTVSVRSGRGGDWNGGPALALAPLRAAYPPESASSGFRCAYPGDEP